MIVVCDTTTVSNFAEAGQLDLLRRVFELVYVTDRVVEEIDAGLREGYAFYGAVVAVISDSSGWLSRAELTTEEAETLGRLPTPLHTGEATSIAVAYRRGWRLVTDDRRAREVAAAMGVTVAGTIGVLVRAVSMQLCSLDQANGYLRAMVAAGYHAPLDDLSPRVSGPKDR